MPMRDRDLGSGVKNRRYPRRDVAWKISRLPPLALPQAQHGHGVRVRSVFRIMPYAYGIR